MDKAAQEGLGKATSALEQHKKLKIIKGSFVYSTKCGSWEEAKEKYKDHTSDEHLGKSMPVFKVGGEVKMSLN